MQKMGEKSRKQKPVPAARAGQNRQRPFSSSSASSSSSSPPAVAGSAAAPAAGKNVDKLLFKNLVEMVPLVETLMEKKPNPAFTRRASIVHTPAPSQVKKVSSSTPKPITKTKSIPPKNLKTPNGNISKLKKDSSKISPPSNSKTLGLPRNLKKEREELALLQEQVKGLESKLLEKESALKSAQDSIEEMNLVSETLEETKRQLENKELLVKSASDELYDAKIALADKQATLEKLEWEGKMSSIKVKELEGDVANMNDEISVLMDVFEKFSPTNNSSKSKESDEESDEEKDENDSSLEIVPISLDDDLGEIDMEKMEVEISKYILALEAAKVNPSEESLDVVAQERLRLQALVLSS